jgi:hypothetical protein
MLGMAVVLPCLPVESAPVIYGFGRMPRLLRAGYDRRIGAVKHLMRLFCDYRRADG